MESNLEYGTSKINEWFETYALSQEQLAKLIAEKVSRAENRSTSSATSRETFL